MTSPHAMGRMPPSFLLKPWSRAPKRYCRASASTCPCATQATTSASGSATLCAEDMTSCCSTPGVRPDSPAALSGGNVRISDLTLTARGRMSAWKTVVVVGIVGGGDWGCSARSLAALATSVVASSAALSAALARPRLPAFAMRIARSCCP